MQKGLLIVFTGDGKGKTTAALGMAIRAAGHGMRVLMLQFIKGSWPYGELTTLRRIEEITIKPLGTGFTWKKDNLEEDLRLAAKGWEEALAALHEGAYQIVILDELNVVLSYGLLSVEPVLDALKNRPPHLHVVITGRGAPQELIDLADLVTEMRKVKHPFSEQGIKAQRGVEF